MNSIKNIEDLARSIPDLGERNKLLNAALRYAEFGLHVFPVKVDSETPLFADWETKATTNTDTINQWWEQYPGANIGIATGRKSGVFVIVIDHDEHNDGINSLIKQFGDVVINIEKLNNCISRTGKTSSSIVFPYQDSTSAMTVSNILAGVSIIGESGYFIAPPSSTPDGIKSGKRVWDDIADYLPNATTWAYKIAWMSLSNQTPQNKHRQTQNLNENRYQ